MKINHEKSSLVIAGIKIDFFSKEISSAYSFNDITLVILQGDYPPQNKCYNNVLAIDSSNGKILWEVEKDENIDFNNPYEGASDAGAYFILFKANSDKIPINKLTGQILRNIDLMTGQRPW